MYRILCIFVLEMANCPARWDLLWARRATIFIFRPALSPDYKIRILRPALGQRKLQIIPHVIKNTSTVVYTRFCHSTYCIIKTYGGVREILNILNPQNRWLIFKNI